MLPNQKSRRGGIQDILIPMEYFRCFQGDFEGNHPSFACDMSGKDAGQDPFFAPVDVVCKSTDPKGGNVVWWESKEKVRFADGTIDYMTIMVIHDNDLTGIYPGVSYPQGHQIAKEGTAGFANGNHIHLEIAKGKFVAQYTHNAKGYFLPNGMAIEKACFADGTTFLTSSNWNWKYTKDVPVETPQPSTPSTPSTTLKGSAIYKWIVDPGDTLSAIAQQMEQSVDKVAWFNGIKDPNIIHVGQVIYNPGYKR